jgi:hypothetical protein
MRNEIKSAAGAIPAAGVVAVLWLTVAHALAQAPATAPFPAYRAPRTADGHPDLNGIWQSFTTANWDIQDHEAQPGPHPEIMATYGAGPAGQGIVEGNEIPYQPWALAKKKENFDKRMIVDVSRDDTWHDTADPELKCYLPGVPRATYMPFPFQIVQGPGDFILIAYEYASATRTIRMNWKGEAPVDSWMGWSRGRWEGDTQTRRWGGLRRCGSRDVPNRRALYARRPRHDRLHVHGRGSQDLDETVDGHDSVEQDKRSAVRVRLPRR